MCLAVPGRILSVDGEGVARSGRVSFEGLVREVNLACVPEAGEGEWVIVHAGFAIACLDEAAAREALADLGAMAGGAP